MSQAELESIEAEGAFTNRPTEEAATAFAAEKEPDDFKVCKKCLGQYNTLSRYGRRL